MNTVSDRSWRGEAGLRERWRDFRDGYDGTGTIVAFWLALALLVPVGLVALVHLARLLLRSW